MNKTTLYIMAGIAALALSSCVKDTLYDAKGNLEVTTTWNNISADASMPDQYTMHLQWTTPDVRFDGGDRTATASGDKHTFADIAVGDYRLTAYNTPQDVRIDGNRAIIEGIVGGSGIAARPGVMFSADHNDYAATLHVSPTATTHATANMVQLMRTINLVLNVVEGDYERIAHATATIDGVYRAIDYVMQSADPADRTRTTDTPLTRTGSKLETSYRLFAIPTADYDNMSLTVNILFDNGDTRAITADISGVTKDFGSDVSPLTITADLRLPVKGGFSGSIDGWKTADGGGYDAQ